MSYYLVGIPSSIELLNLAKERKPHADINELHRETWKLMVEFRERYYEQRVDELLSSIDLMDIDNRIRQRIKTKMLEPIVIKDKNKTTSYSNFMEEVSRRVSQTFQPISGNLAELCFVNELTKQGLVEGTHFIHKGAKHERTDFIIYHPTLQNEKARHRVEVKNVKLRERAVRGLVFDGDSLAGFFDRTKQFTQKTVTLIDERCKTTGGFCYLPPDTLQQIRYTTERFRSNARFAEDMANFVKIGVLN